MLMTPRCLFHLRHIRHIDIGFCGLLFVFLFSLFSLWLSQLHAQHPRSQPSIFQDWLSFFLLLIRVLGYSLSVSHLPALFFHYFVLLLASAFLFLAPLLFPVLFSLAFLLPVVRCIVPWLSEVF